MNITVIIPSYNQGRFIRRTLESILRQTYDSLQIIVSDGGSTDETVEILQSYGDRIKWWSKPDKGFADAVNKCIPLITGDVVAIQSSDDYYLPEAFATISRLRRERPDLSIISGGAVSIDLAYNIRHVSVVSGPITPLSHLHDILPQHATFISTGLFRELGGVRPEVDMCADIDLWYRASHLATGWRTDAILAVYQLHPDQRTSTSKKWAESLEAMVEHAESAEPYAGKFRLTATQKGELFASWRTFWAYAINDARSETFAREIVAKGMKGHSLKFKSLQFFYATRSEKGPLRRILYYLKHRSLHVAVWATATRLIKRYRCRSQVASLELRWV